MLVLMALITTAMTAPLLWAIWLRHEGKSQAPDTLELPDENYLSHSVHDHTAHQRPDDENDSYETANFQPQLSISDFQGAEDTAKGHSPHHAVTFDFGDLQANGASVKPSPLVGVSSV